MTYTITCHDVYNYGASLQAYALQKYLQSIGIDNRIIDYMPDYLAWHYHLSWFISSRGNHYGMMRKNFLLRGLYVLHRYLKDMKSLSRKHAFDNFRNANMILTERCSCINDINSVVDDADVLIAGSDQIWNSFSLENGLDHAFYLAFGPKSAKRISYAASFGANEIKSQHKTFVAEQLKHFDKISVREGKGLSLLESFGLKGQVVMDPVFLLDQSFWIKVANKPVLNNPYILVYAIGGMSDGMRNMISQIEQEGKYQVIAIRSNKATKGIQEIGNAGPADFISLIKGAVCVLSNSFHATAFSIIFHKPFYSFPYGNKKSSERIQELLRILGLTERYDCNCFSLEDVMNYECVQEILDVKRNESRKWLKDSIINKDDEK